MGSVRSCYMKLGPFDSDSNVSPLYLGVPHFRLSDINHNRLIASSFMSRGKHSVWHFSVGVKSIYIKTGDGLLAASLGPSPTLKICDSTHTCCKTGYLDHNGWDRGKPGQIDYYFSGNILSECRQVLFNVIENKTFLKVLFVCRLSLTPQQHGQPSLWKRTNCSPWTNGT